MDNQLYYKYVTLQGDTYDSIALDFYTDEFKADLIIKANPLSVGTLVFDAGVELYIPIVNTVDQSKLPPWRQT